MKDKIDSNSNRLEQLTESHNYDGVRDFLHNLSKEVPPNELAETLKQWEMKNTSAQHRGLGLLTHDLPDVQLVAGKDPNTTSVFIGEREGGELVHRTHSEGTYNAPLHNGVGHANHPLLNRLGQSHDSLLPGWQGQNKTDSLLPGWHGQPEVHQVAQLHDPVANTFLQMGKQHFQQVGMETAAGLRTVDTHRSTDAATDLIAKAGNNLRNFFDALKGNRDVQLETTAFQKYADRVNSVPAYYAGRPAVNHGGFGRQSYVPHNQSNVQHYAKRR